MKKIDIYSDEVSNYNDQLLYKNSFLEKYGDKIPSDDPFYFDDVEAVDENGETIRGISLNTSTWAEITKVLIRYFHIEL